MVFVKYIIPDSSVRRQESIVFMPMRLKILGLVKTHKPQIAPTHRIHANDYIAVR